jgi:hypothetical protein
MMDIMSGPNAPVTRACQWCGWAAVPPIDIKIDPGMDIDSKPVQDAIRQELASVHFVMMAIECSTKSRAREIPIAGAKRPPRQLRSVECPMGLPGLTPQEQQRVDKDNRVCRFLLELAAEAPALGQANVRENPLNSYHWLDPAEVEMQESGAWQDTIYDACVFAGARRKRQKLRHNVDELSALPSLKCCHIHSKDEWTPWMAEGGQWTYPSAEESEYTASLAFTIAVAVSWWAARTGVAKLRVHRMPPLETAGDRRGWLSMDPRALREWAMAPLAISLGLTPPKQDNPYGVPKRWSAAELLQEVGKVLPADHVYVGPGHHSHRWPTTKWKSDFLPGRDGSVLQCLARYTQQLQVSSLQNSLSELQGYTLVCDCAMGSPCHADVLAAAVWQRTLPQEELEARASLRTKPAAQAMQSTRQSRRQPKAVWRAVTLIAAGQTMPAQHCICAGRKSLSFVHLRVCTRSHGSKTFSGHS